MVQMKLRVMPKVIITPTRPHGNPPIVPFRLSKPIPGIRWHLCLAGTLLLGMTGCAAPLPKLTPSLPAQWQHKIGSDQAKADDLHGWWHAFGDPELNALVDRALANNLDVAQAIERLRAVRELYHTADARYLPSLRISTNDVVDPSASASYFLVGFDANWELGLFGRSEGTRREAQGALDARFADLRTAQVSLVAEVVRDWVELRTAQQQEQLLSGISQAHQHEWELLKVRRNLQLVSSSAVDKAQASFERSKAALAAPRQSINASAQRLAVLLGQNHPDPAWLKAAPPPELGQWKLDSTPANLIRTRPEIARAEADVLQAAGALALAHADLFPSLGIGGSIDWSAEIENNHKYGHGPSGIVSLGPEINIPLFDWGIRLANEHAKDHELKASVLAYRQAVLQGVAEVETALGSLQQQEQREAQSAAAWRALQRVDQSMQTRQRLHLASSLEQTESHIAASEAAVELSDARAAHSLAYIALFKALGGAPLPRAEQPATPAAQSNKSDAGMHR